MSAKLIDQADRDAAIVERRRNVLIDAGAGTGKTTLLVARFVELLAPASGAPGVPIERLAAVTFTRRAAGELRLRIREGMLRAIADEATSEARRAVLRTALGGLDAAWVGTIHSFADRLLRLEPMACGLSPDYAILEDSDELHAEAWLELLDVCERRALPAWLEGVVSPALAAEAQASIVDAVRAGLPTETQLHDYNSTLGLDALVAGFITHRDTPPVEPTVVVPDLQQLEELSRGFLRLVASAGDASPGQRFLKRVAKTLKQVPELEPTEALHLLLELSPPKHVTKRDHFGDDEAGWAAWKEWSSKSQETTSLSAQVLAPYQRWMAARLVRAFPAVIAVFEVVKQRRQVVDQVDLLLKLRDLLRDRPRVRARYQALFDHLFIDEFQDTDPLQAEILLFLCEAGQAARRWNDVDLMPGKLTLVGDPKQSIYRFRRADVQMYDDVRSMVARASCLAVSLRANFRSTAPLIEWFNHRFEHVLGAPPEQRPFDATTGVVFHAPLAVAPISPAGAQAPVWPLEFECEAGRADERRAFEARAWAQFLKWLVEEGKAEVRDLVSGELRPVRYGDVALLAHATTKVPLLLEELDRLGIPWSARGGALFLQDSIHRQFLLGLRALANREDGVAEMALLRPPFFAVDPGDVACARAEDCAPAVQERVAEVRGIVAELRRRRFERPPGDTGRDLLEQTGFGRMVASGPNGAQRLDRLRELCFVLDRVAVDHQLDFDGATAELRRWAVDAPPQLDAPHPVASEAVQVLSIHQAKGLEFPLVGLWDAQAGWEPRAGGGAWAVSPSGAEWSVGISGLDCSEPESSTWGEREHCFAAAERRRLVYVAATRARDGLVIPTAGAADDRFITDTLLADAPAKAFRALPKWVESRPAPSWARSKPVPTFKTLPVAGPWVEQALAAWREAATGAMRQRLEPVAVSVEAHRLVEAMRAEDEDEVAEPPEKRRVGRFGREFGTTVHRALALALADAALSESEAVRRAAAEVGLAEHLLEAEGDVRRTLATLAATGLRRGSRGEWAVEYPVSWPEDGKLLNGSIDLLIVEGGWRVIDFKTDAKPVGEVSAALPHYAEQVRSYARILEASGLAPSGSVAAALLFTEDGSLVAVPRS